MTGREDGSGTASGRNACGTGGPGGSTASGDLAGLHRLLGQQAEQGHPPVHLWHPPRRRDIGLAIAADGTWLYRGSAIARPAMVRLFASVMRREPDGGHCLVTPYEQVLVAVEDAPFLAVEMSVTGAGRQQLLDFRTNVEDRVTCGPGHPLRFGSDAATGAPKPYLMVRGGLEALLTRPLYYDLVDLAVIEGDELGVWSGGMFFAMADAGGLEGISEP